MNLRRGDLFFGLIGVLALCAALLLWADHAALRRSGYRLGLATVSLLKELGARTDKQIEVGE
jgi:hypothetical protein